MFGRRRRHGHGPGGGRGRGRGRGAGHGHGFRGEGSTLDRVRPGEYVEIGLIDDEIARAQAIRLGLGEGTGVTCVTKLPQGPVVLRCGMQEIAVGRGLARRIGVSRDVRLCDTEPGTESPDASE